MTSLKSTLNQRIDDVSVTFNQRIVTSQTFSCFFFALFQKDVKALKNIMHLKTNKYARNEIMSKRTLSQKSKRSMSLSSRQRSVSVVQITSNQSNNAFNVLKDRFNSRIKSESTLTFTTTSLDSQIQSTLKSRDRLSNSRKTIESSQNEKL